MEPLTFAFIAHLQLEYHEHGQRKNDQVAGQMECAANDVQRHSVDATFSTGMFNSPSESNGITLEDKGLAQTC